MNPKQNASLKALDYIEEDMVIGLGSGSTAAHFIRALGDKCQKGFKILAVASSLESEHLAKESRIPLSPIELHSKLDITVDGADEVDPQKRLIKGAGGALVREKILAAMSREMIVVVDDSKLVDHLGKCPLPVEIIPFGAKATQKHLENLGFSGKWREKPNHHSPYYTDNGNLILDLKFPSPRMHPEKDETAIRQIPGVIETGFFLRLAKRIIIGYTDGSIKVIQ